MFLLLRHRLEMAAAPQATLVASTTRRSTCRGGGGSGGGGEGGTARSPPPPPEEAPSPSELLPALAFRNSDAALPCARLENATGEAGPCHGVCLVGSGLTETALPPSARIGDGSGRSEQKRVFFSLFFLSSPASLFSLLSSRRLSNTPGNSFLSFFFACCKRACPSG